VPWQQRGVATASTMFFRTIGGTLAVGVMGGVLSAALERDLRLGEVGGTCGGLAAKRQPSGRLLPGAGTQREVLRAAEEPIGADRTCGSAGASEETPPALVPVVVRADCARPTVTPSAGKIVTEALGLRVTLPNGVELSFHL